MNEQQIRETCDAAFQVLGRAIANNKIDPVDRGIALTSAFHLTTQLLVDVNRIANALEKLAGDKS